MGLLILNATKHFKIREIKITGILENSNTPVLQFFQKPHHLSKYNVACSVCRAP